MEEIFKKCAVNEVSKYSWGAKPKTKNTKNMLLHMIDDMQKCDSEDNINVDIADIKMVLNDKGIFDINISEQVGSTSAKRAIEAVLEGVLPINKLNSILIVFELSPVYKIKKLAKLLVKYIYDLGDDDTNIIFGTTINNTFKDTQIKVTLLTNMIEFDHITAHKYTRNNRQYIEQSNLCGCCYCMTQFTSDEVVEYVGDNNTAICPNCPIDSVVCDKIVPISDKLLEDMNKHWFS